MSIPGFICATSDKVSIFENKVFKGLKCCGVSFNQKLGAELSDLNNERIYPDKPFSIRIGAAVSGGADSVSLLYSLVHILSKIKHCKDYDDIILYVITVNHFIRPREETCGDVDFVVKCCNDLNKSGFKVECTVIELEPGEVAALAGKRQAGTEEAARFLRYSAFDKFINDKKLDYLCLAHNKNDQLETILMRFLQGSNVDGAGGIKISRNKFIRPLLNISRKEIEEYLLCQKLSWRNDKTNNDTNYYRNNVRHNLIPLLDNKFPGWEKAVISGADKACEDSDIICGALNCFPIEVETRKNKKNITFEEIDSGEIRDYKFTKINFKKDNFIKAYKGIQKRLLMKACNILGESKRIPDVFLTDVINSLNNCDSNSFSKVYDNIEITVEKDIVFVKKYVKKDTDLVFFDIIDDNGVYDFPFGKLSVTFNNSVIFVSLNGCNSVIKCCYPLCIRNARQGDEIKCNNGKMKKVSDIYSDWHVASSDKNLIPVICSLQNDADNLKCILGAFLGYKDWIVR